MRYLTGVYWERGRRAMRNQDSVVLLQVLTARGRVLMAVVCDGMGGLEQGETASGYVTRRLQEWFYASLLRAIRKRKAYWIIRRSVERLVYDMQEQLSRYAGQEEICLGSTMTVLVLWEKTYLLWHLGDSRACRVSAPGRGGDGRAGLHCMTTDHVRGRDQLTKCVGSFGFMRPDFKMGSFGTGQAFVLCSDGFRHCVTEQETADVLNPAVITEEVQAERRLREIGEACMKRGEADNLSAVYIKACR